MTSVIKYLPTRTSALTVDEVAETLAYVMGDAGVTYPGEIYPQAGCEYVWQYLYTTKQWIAAQMRRHFAPELTMILHSNFRFHVDGGFFVVIFETPIGRLLSVKIQAALDTVTGQFYPVDGAEKISALIHENFS
jgi:hypothetical protein